MLLQTAESLFASPDWTYESKWDGFRMLASVRDGAVRLVSRNGRSFTNLFAPVADALRGFPVPLVLDGEVIAVNGRGQPGRWRSARRCSRNWGRSCRRTR